MASSSSSCSPSSPPATPAHPQRSHLGEGSCSDLLKEEAPSGRSRATCKERKGSFLSGLMGDAAGKGGARGTQDPSGLGSAAACCGQQQQDAELEA